MSWNRCRSTLVATVVLSTACALACQATYNERTGEMNIRFAPDMVIHANGLEDALDQLTDLMGQCLDGTFGRPCTDAERADIKATTEKVLEAKGRRPSEPPEAEESHEAA